MKKFLIVLLLLIQMVVFAPKVNAVYTFSTSISGASVINKGSSFTVNVNVSTTTKIYSFEGNLSYDHSKLQQTGAACLFANGCNATVGSRAVFDSGTSRSGSFTVGSITFIALAAFSVGQSTTITISGVTGSLGSSDIPGTNASRTITIAVPKSSNNDLSSLKVDGVSVPSFSASTTSYNAGSTANTSIAISATVADLKASVSGTGSKALVYGANSFPIRVTAENGSVKAYTVNITRTDPRSTNNFLSAITLNAGTLTFSQDTGNYVVVVENNVTSITIGASVADSKSTLTGIGTFDLKVYSNKFPLTVTAENQTTRIYTVDIVRKDELGFSRELSSDNTLATLAIEGITVPFAPLTTQYVLNVDTAVASVNIAATVHDATAKAVFTPVAPLAFGQNVVNVTVTAENGEKRIYALFIYRKSDAPVVSIDDIVKTLDTMTGKAVILVPGISGIIPKEVLDKAAAKGIVLSVEKRDEFGRVIYFWTFTGAAADTRTNINTNLSFASPDKEAILALINYADGLILNFAHTGPIVAGTTVKIYVGAQFEDGMMLNLYLFDKVKNKLTLSVEKVEVKNGFVELTMAHASEYYLTRATLKTNKTDSVFFIASIIEAGLILSLLIYMVLRRQRKAV